MAIHHLNQQAISHGARVLSSTPFVIAMRKTAERWMRRPMVDFRRGYEMVHLDMEKAIDLMP